MKAYTILAYFLLTCCCWLAGCEETEAPTNLLPKVTVNEAEEITRTTALLKGKVEKPETTVVNSLTFCYGTSEKMTQEAACNPTETAPSVHLSGLTPNTTYYYCLKAGNGHSQVQSTTGTFTTEPNKVPTLGNLCMLSQSPLSITLQYELTDDGGEPLQRTGFYYCAEGETEQQVVLESTAGTSFRKRIGKLKAQTAYTIQAFAANSVGETRSESFSFRTEQAVVVTEAGMLSETIDAYEKYLHTSLSIAGPLNGTDIRYIREMLGRDVQGNATEGRMNLLNLSDASIVSGGLSYNATRYTEENVVSYGMFADCDYLQKLYLPNDALRLEENAFANCPLLTAIQIPASATQVEASAGCSSLTNIEVNGSNTTFATSDGVLYNKQFTTLYWFPEGKESCSAWPETVTTIEQLAFRNCRLTQLSLPASLKTIKKAAFFNAALTECVIPDGVSQLPEAVFQQCSALHTVKLGSGITYLYGYCFDGCPLQHIYIKADEFPPMCQADTFNGAESQFATCTLHVPAGSKNRYRNATYWGQFEQITEE